jgi:hypothetical protein
MDLRETPQKVLQRYMGEVGLGHFRDYARNKMIDPAAEAIPGAAFGSAAAELLLTQS